MPPRAGDRTAGIAAPAHSVDMAITPAAVLAAEAGEIALPARGAGAVGVEAAVGAEAALEAEALVVEASAVAAEAAGNALVHSFAMQRSMRIEAEERRFGMSLAQAMIYRWTIGAAILAFVVGVVACNKQQEKPQAAQNTFASPDDAANALTAAAKSGNGEAVLAVLGSGSKDVVSTGDAARDKADMTGFASDYDTMHRWRKLPDGSEILITGTDNKTFPLPLKKNTSGQWYFDVQAGEQELLARQIGRDELAAIDISEEIAAAQRQYFSQRHEGASQYAQKFISDEGKQDGLYWPEVSGQPRSPLGPLVAYATAEGIKVQPNQHQPFYGYYFAMLDKQGTDAKGGAKDYVVNGKMTGGFAVVAYPAEYRQSGVMTFIINQNGPLLQKDLGNSTDQVAAAMTEFNPDKSWTLVE